MGLVGCLVDVAIIRHIRVEEFGSYSFLRCERICEKVLFLACVLLCWRNQLVLGLDEMFHASSSNFLRTFVKLSTDDLKKNAFL